jgi:hypothetical protein
MGMITLLWLSLKALPFTIAITWDGVDVPDDHDPRLLMC